MKQSLPIGNDEGVQAKILQTVLSLLASRTYPVRRDDLSRAFSICLVLPRREVDKHTPVPHQAGFIRRFPHTCQREPRRLGIRVRCPPRPHRQARLVPDCL